MTVGRSASESVLRKGDLVPDHALTEREADEFNHTEIAERVADLLTTADPPLNVALFGPWGSGKSSFATLLKKALTKRRMKTKFVVYDAWKYSGEALQRSFIADVADKLGVDDPLFTSRLGQTVEQTQLDLKQVSWEQARALWRWVTVLLAPVSVVLLAGGVGVIALISWAAGKNVGQQLIEHIPTVLAAPLAAVIVGAVLKVLVDTTKVKLVEGPPTEERFEARFKSLLKAARGDHQRFVFFVDELDRVSARQVVETLSIIKNFLDQPNAVFIVAADKQVLEQAFQKLPQATPTNEDEPYYSSASEFLDKIFQHQLSLPPLRGPSLFRFAHDLVADRTGGLWQELKKAEPDGAFLDSVLYVLIPSHVRSPRRVKVLLNNFATNARIAQSRTIDWMTRAHEIAKLTVLQTEFPLFAADLHIEPRLPGLVLDSSGYILSERTKRLLARHGVGSSDGQAEEAREAGDEGDVADAAVGAVEGSSGGVIVDANERSTEDLPGATDQLLVPAADQPRLVSVQRENLRRYLIRTDEIPNPSRELLFLEPGGAAEGLTDAVLGELLEAETVDNPAAVLAAARERTKEEQQAIVRVLAGMSEQAYAEERSNVITALLDVVRLLKGDLGPSLQAAASAVGSFARMQRLQERQLTGALRVGIALASATGDTALRDDVLEDERLLQTRNRVRVVADLLDDIPEEAAERVHEAVAEKLGETTDVLTEPLQLVSPGAAEALLLNQEVRTSLQALINGAAADDAEVVATDLFDALDARSEDAPDARLRIMRILADSGSPAVYPVIRQHTEDALTAAGTSQISNGVALAALPLASPSDWERWLPWLDEAAEAYDPHKQMADLALIRLGGLLTEADEDELEVALKLAPKVARVGRLSDDDLSNALTSTVQLALQARSWWADTAAFTLQEKVHSIVRALGTAVGPSTASSFAALRFNDLLRAPMSAGMTIAFFQAVARWAIELEAEQVRDLATRLSGVALPGTETTDVELVAARTHLWREASALDEDVDEPPYDVDLDEIAAVSRSGSERAQEVVVAWLDARIVEEAVQGLVTRIERPPAPLEADAFRAWFHDLESADARTKFLTVLAGEGDHALAWLREAVAVSPREYSEEVVAHSIASDAMKASRAEERRAAVDAVVALSPSTSDAQRVVGNLIVWLLGRKQRVDFDIALAAVDALGSGHGMGRKVGNAFRRACEEQGRKIPRGRRLVFEEAKIVLAQNYFEKPKKRGRLPRLPWKK